MTPEISHSVFLAHDHVRVWTLTRHLREGGQCSIRYCFHQRCVAHQGDAFELSVQVATAIEAAAVEWAYDSVVLNQTDHRHGVNRALRQELENFCGMAIRQSLDADGIERRRYLTFVYFWCCARLQHWSTFVVLSSVNCLVTEIVGIVVRHNCHGGGSIAVCQGIERLEKRIANQHAITDQHA